MLTRGRRRVDINSVLPGSHRLSHVPEFDLARTVFATDRTHQRHRRVLTIFDLALGQRRDMDLHSAPSFRAETVVRGGGPERYACRLVGPRGQPDADDDHVKRDGDDGRHLAVNVSTITFQ